MRHALLLVLGVALAACASTADDGVDSTDDALGSCTQATVTAGLNLRATPDTAGPIVVTMTAGATVDVLDAGAATGWARVRFNGQEGWAKASYLACAAAPSTAGKPVLSAPHVDDAAITIDGAGGEAAWATAPKTTFDTDWSGKATVSNTTVRSLWSEHAFYMLWEIEGTGLNTDQSKPINVERENLYNEDCVEVFFTPNPATPKKYFEIELGPFGHFFDLAIDKGANTSDEKWSSDLTIKTTTDAAAHRAVIEVAFRNPDMVAALKSGASLPINMFRMEGKTSKEYLAWSPTRTPRPNFHVPEAFGTLKLE